MKVIAIMPNGRAASHGKSNWRDKQSISLVERILTTHERVMPQLQSIDKWPNIDGYLELQDDDGDLIGRIEVQVKTLPQNHDYKLSINTPFLYYCRDVSQIPVLLLCVDLLEEKVYWIHVNRQFLSSLNLENKQKKKTIHLTADQFFDMLNKNYIHKWELVVKASKERVHNYDELQNAYKVLREASNLDIGRTSPYFYSIHKFLDELNEMLDKKFPVVKRVFFPNAWKVGFAYYTYTESALSYILYPIDNNYNDVQIKRIDITLHNKLINRVWAIYFGSNPIMNDPRKVAIEIVRNYVSKLISGRLLDNYCDFLALEFVYSIIKRNLHRLKIIHKDAYTIEEIEVLISSGIIEQALRYQSGTVKYLYHVFYESFSYLKDKGFSTIYNINKDYISLLTYFSEQEFEAALFFFLENVVSTYDYILEQNFPSLKKELSLFGEANIIIVSYANEKGTDTPSRLWIEAIYSESITEDSRNIIIRRRAEYDEEEFVLEFIHQNSVQYNGDYYEPMFSFSSGIGFLFHDMPMMDFIYERLEQKIQNYLIKEGHEYL